MTKKEQLLRIAEKLFAEEGYAGTSTAKIAREAGVSEGLIFRHFGSKEGLLDAVIESGIKQARKFYDQVSGIENPKYALKSIIRLPFSLRPEDHHFWKIYYTRKLMGEADDQYLHENLRNNLIRIFSALGYRDPLSETSLLLMHLDGIAQNILCGDTFDSQTLLESLYTKYQLI